MADALKCINCGATFELVLKRNEYSCSYCNTSYKVKRDITKDDVKPMQNNRALTVDIRFEYRGNVWKNIIGLMICVIIGVSFSILTILSYAPIFIGIIGGIVGIVSFCFVVFQTVNDCQKHRIAIIKRINEFHEWYFKAEKNRIDNLDWSLIRVGATDKVLPITIKSQEGKKVWTVKCSSCGSFVDLQNFLEKDIFTCGHCSATYEKKVAQIKKTAKRKREPEVASKPKPRREWGLFAFITIVCGIFIVIGIADLITGFANGMKFALCFVVPSYIGLCILFYYGKLDN